MVVVVVGGVVDVVVDAVVGSGVVVAVTNLLLASVAVVASCFFNCFGLAVSSALVQLSIIYFCVYFVSGGVVDGFLLG